MKVRIDYGHDDSFWVATSPDVEGYVAFAETLDELRALVGDGVPYFLGLASVDLDERFPSADEES